jgi:hypothetical protein
MTVREVQRAKPEPHRQLQSSSPPVHLRRHHSRVELVSSFPPLHAFLQRQPRWLPIHVPCSRSNREWRQESHTAEASTRKANHTPIGGYHLQLPTAAGEVQRRQRMQTRWRRPRETPRTAIRLPATVSISSQSEVLPPEQPHNTTPLHI